MTSEKLKEEGNKYFLKQNYKEAIELYSLAIQKSPNTCIYYTNRALCYLKLQKWPSVVDDCRHAIELDSRSIKAHFYLGQALAEQAQYDDALVYLKRADELTKELNENYGDEITRSIRNTKRRRWNALDEVRQKQEIKLQTYLNRLMLEDKLRKINELKQSKLTSPPPLPPPPLVKQFKSDINLDKFNEATNKMDLNESLSFASVSSHIDDDNNTNNKSIEEIEQEYESNVSELNKLFTEVDTRRRKREIPDYLCGKISFELMTDPVITPSGITYDRRDIEMHLSRLGHFDPVTRKELTIDQLIPNLAMKEVIENFVAENDWVDGAI